MKNSLKYWGLSVLSGFLLTFSWPSRGIPFLLFFAFVPLLIVEDGLSGSRYKSWKIIGYAYVSFFIWNLLTTYWIYFSSPEGAYMAIGVNSLIMAMVFWLFHRTKNALGANRGYVSLVVYWLAFEYLHLDWDLSWPWLMLGNGFANYIQFVQWYDITGVLGGTFWILLINILMFQLWKRIKDNKSAFFQYLLIGFIIIAPIIISLLKYYTYHEKKNPINIVLVQPNIDPWKDKFSGMTPKEQMDRILNLATPLLDSTIDYIICPETAIPVGVWHHELTYNQQILDIKNFISPYPRLKFITGITHLQLFKPGDDIPQTASPYGRKGLYYDDHNSAIQIDHSSEFKLYHKSKLVPGPEMFPFAEVLKPLQDKLFGKLGGQIGDMGTQKERTVFYNEFKNVNAAPVICYESIYGEFVGDYMLKGGNFISVSTNDAWWGDTPGYKQLLAYTRLRAVETRRSIARSANTGISCFINQRGDVIQPTPYNQTMAIKGVINANDNLTFYTRYRDYLGRGATFFSVLLIFYAFVRGFLNKRKV